MSDDREADLESRLAARTDAQGKAKKGYGQNVKALRAELQRMAAARTLHSVDSGGANARHR